MGALRIYWPDHKEDPELRALLAETGQFDFCQGMDEDLVLGHFGSEDAKMLRQAAEEGVPVRILELQSTNYPHNFLSRRRLRKLCAMATHILMRCGKGEAAASSEYMRAFRRMLRGWGYQVWMRTEAESQENTADAEYSPETAAVTGYEEPVFMAIADDTVKPVVDGFLLMLAEFPDASLLLKVVHELSEQELERISYFPNIKLIKDFKGIPADVKAVMILTGCEDFVPMAVAARKPVIAFDTSVITDGETGITVDAEQRDELIRALKLLIRQPDLAEIIVQGALRHADETDAVKMVRNYCRWIADSLKSASKNP